MKNVKSDKGAGNSDFIGPSIYGGSIYKGNLAISFFWIYFWYIVLS